MYTDVWDSQRRGEGRPDIVEPSDAFSLQSQCRKDMGEGGGGRGREREGERERERSWRGVPFYYCSPFSVLSPPRRRSPSSPPPTAGNVRSIIHPANRPPPPNIPISQYPNIPIFPPYARLHNTPTNLRPSPISIDPSRVQSLSLPSLPPPPECMQRVCGCRGCHVIVVPLFNGSP